MIKKADWQPLRTSCTQENPSRRAHFSPPVGLAAGRGSRQHTHRCPSGTACSPATHTDYHVTFSGIGAVCSHCRYKYGTVDNIIML
jgi:hypothetical protein